MSNDAAAIEEMLRTARTIAVVGMSDKPWRASHNIGLYLAAHGYRVFPVEVGIARKIEDLGQRGIDGKDEIAMGG